MHITVSDEDYSESWYFCSAGEYTEALRQLADDVYHSSLAFGTDDIRTSGGYFHMANIFHKQDQMDTANSLYEKVMCLKNGEFVLEPEIGNEFQILKWVSESVVKPRWYFMM